MEQANKQACVLLAFLDELSKERAHSSSSPALHSLCHLPLDLLAHSFSFLSLPALSHVGVNHDFHRAALQAWNNKLELELTGAMMEKGFDLLLIKNRYTHLQKLVVKELNGHDQALVDKLVESLTHTPSLVHMELSNAGLGRSSNNDDYQFGVAALAPVLAQLPLQFLDLSKNNLSQISSSLSSALFFLKSLHHLDLSYCSIGTSSLPAFASSLSHLPELRFLSLRGANLSSSPSSFFSSLQHLSKLEHLNIGETQIAPKASELAAVLPHLAQLHYLELRSNHLDDTAFARLFTSIASLPLLQSLDLSGASLSSASIAAFSSVFPQLSSLQKLWLDDNPSVVAACAALATALPQLHALTGLHLASCAITTEGFALLASAFPSLPSLQRVNVSDNSIRFGSLQFHFSSSLTYLWCGRNRADDGDVMGLCDALLPLSHLTLLSLYNMQIDMPGIAFFCCFLPRFVFSSILLILDLDCIHFENLGLKFLASAFPYLPSLIKLYLQDTSFTDMGLPFLSASLHHLISLQVLDISHNAITSAGILSAAPPAPSFVAALATLPHLRKLFIHDDALAEIRSRFLPLIADSRTDDDEQEELDSLLE